MTACSLFSCTKWPGCSTTQFSSGNIIAQHWGIPLIGPCFLNMLPSNLWHEFLDLSVHLLILFECHYVLYGLSGQKKCSLYAGNIGARARLLKIESATLFFWRTRFLRVKCSWHYFRPVCSEKQTKIFLSCIECRLFSQIVTSFSWTTACIGLTAGHHLPLFMSIVEAVWVTCPARCRHLSCLTTNIARLAVNIVS